MLSFLLKNAGTIVVALIILAIVVAIVANMIKCRKKAKSSCGGGCASCPMAGACHKK